MKKKKNMYGRMDIFKITGACLLLFLLQGCLRSGTQGFGLQTWFKKASYTYEIYPINEGAQQNEQSSSRMTLNIEDWNGYYDPYLQGYQVFPGQDTMPAREVVDEMKRLVEPALDNVKDRMDTERHGTINFGGIRFKGALIDFHFEGDIKDPGKAFGLLNHNAATTVTLRQGVMNVDAPVPAWTRNNWVVTVVCPGKIRSSNAPEQDVEHKKLIWTDKSINENRIRFEIEIQSHS